LDQQLTGLRIVLKDNAQARDVSKVVYQVDTLFRIWALAKSDRPSNTRSLEQIRVLVRPWNAVDGLRLSQARTGSIDLGLFTTLVDPKKVIGSLIDWFDRNFDPTEYKRREAEADSAVLDVERKSDVNKTARIMDGYDLERARIDTARARVKLFNEAITEVYDPLIARGFSEEQARRAAEIAAGSTGSLISLQERNGPIISIEEAFEDLH
jgi:hypothetical protein